jgi:hypothetical protein
MLEGGGKTPILSPIELEEIGYKIIAYPLSLIGVSMRAMEVYFSFIYVNRMFFIHVCEQYDCFSFIKSAKPGARFGTCRV